MSIKLTFRALALRQSGRRDYLVAYMLGLDALFKNTAQQSRLGLDPELIDFEASMLFTCFH